VGHLYLRVSGKDLRLTTAKDPRENGANCPTDDEAAYADSSIGQELPPGHWRAANGGRFGCTRRGFRGGRVLHMRISFGSEQTRRTDCWTIFK